MGGRWGVVARSAAIVGFAASFVAAAECTRRRLVRRQLGGRAAEGAAAVAESRSAAWRRWVCFGVVVAGPCSAVVAPAPSVADSSADAAVAAG